MSTNYFLTSRINYLRKLYYQYNIYFIRFYSGRVTAPVDLVYTSFFLATQDHSKGSPHGIYRRQSDTTGRFSRGISVSPVSHHSSTMPVLLYYLPWGVRWANYVARCHTSLPNQHRKFRFFLVLINCRLCEQLQMHSTHAPPHKSCSETANLSHNPYLRAN
jgi:hypothetical protein